MLYIQRVVGATIKLLNVKRMRPKFCIVGVMKVSMQMSVVISCSCMSSVLPFA